MIINITLLCTALLEVGLMQKHNFQPPDRFFLNRRNTGMERRVVDVHR